MSVVIVGFLNYISTVVSAIQLQSGKEFTKRHFFHIFFVLLPYS